jgi:hypothetical protein
MFHRRNSVGLTQTLRSPALAPSASQQPGCVFPAARRVRPAAAAHLPSARPPRVPRAQKTLNGQRTLYGAFDSQDIGFCRDGCPIPFNGTYDPFVENTQWGFRGRNDAGRLAGTYTSGAEYINKETACIYQ